MTAHASAKQRIIAKHDHTGWGVYDTVRASWPDRVPGFGVVKQKLTSKAQAEAEAARLDAFYRGP